jgi:hypothetical protein
MTTSKNGNNENVVPVVDELDNWVTTKRASEFMGVELPSVGAIVHSGRVQAIRIGGIFLVDKNSAVAFGKHREEIANAASDRKIRNERLAMLSNLSNEQLEQLLSQVEAK